MDTKITIYDFLGGIVFYHNYYHLFHNCIYIYLVHINIYYFNNTSNLVNSIKNYEAIVIIYVSNIKVIIKIVLSIIHLKHSQIFFIGNKKNFKELNKIGNCLLFNFNVNLDNFYINGIWDSKICIHISILIMMVNFLNILVVDT